MNSILTEKSNLEKVRGDKKYFIIFITSLIVLSFLSIYFLKSQTVQGDGISYAETMQVLQGNPVPVGFLPNRILTTFFGLEVIIILSKIFGSIQTAWIIVNLFFYFVLDIFFYKILESLFQSQKTAFLGGLFLASNYALIVFGLTYLMDIGGWALYMVSLYYTLHYIQSHERKYILFSALAVGMGGLFKEYAFLAFIPILVAIFWPARTTVQSGGDSRRNISRVIRQLIVPAILASSSIFLVYVYVYHTFHYTYLDWFGANKVTYAYHSRIVEYIKSLGVLNNFLSFVFFGGIIVIIKKWNEIDEKIKLFILSVGLSILPIFLWPAITERILFITIPFVISISSFFIKKYERIWYVFLIPLILYCFASFFMDSVVLKFINLPF